MAKLNAPFRYDYVGSFLRPERLKQARKDFENNIITKKELEKIEDEEITNLIKDQKAAGYHVICDGEFRRSYWHLDFMWGFKGIEHIELDHGYFFHGEETTHGSIKVVKKISGEDHPFVDHFKFVKQFEDENTVARQTIPAPAQLFAELFREDNGKQTQLIYPDFEVLIQDIVKAYRTVIEDLYIAGCRNIQFDDCTWGMFCDQKYLEFDDERSGNFEPLRFIPNDKKVVLGLITTKSPTLEDKEVIKQRIYEASKYVNFDRLYLSPQCGFASCEIGNKLTKQQQWDKLKLVKEIAKEIWEK